MGRSKALSIYLIAAFLWRALTAAHEYPSTTMRNMTIGLDLLCLIGLIGTRIHFFKNSLPGELMAWKILFWAALAAGAGLLLIRQMEMTVGGPGISGTTCCQVPRVINGAAVNRTINKSF
jgi:hypothetical protein